MPDNKVNERLLRLKVIDELFTSQPGKTFLPEEIIDRVNTRNPKWKYNRHKFARDLKFLENDKGIRLIREKCRPSLGVGRTITRYGYKNSGASVFHGGLSHTDKLLIKNILDILQLKGIDSLGSFIKNEDNYGKDVLKNYTPIISFTKNLDKERDVSDKLNKLYKLIQARTCIKIQMKDRLVTSKITERIVHPWYLREYNRRWYLFGLEIHPKSDEIQRYALDCMIKISKYGYKPYQQADKSIDDILADVIGVSFKKEDVTEEIIFWVSTISSDYIESKPMHSTMMRIDIEEVLKTVPHMLLQQLPHKDGIFVKMRCIDNYELRREMMSFGGELIVLYPNDLRERIKKIIKVMYDNYK